MSCVRPERDPSRALLITLFTLFTLLALALIGCAPYPRELPVQLSLRYRFLDERREGTRPHLEAEHRLELFAELRPPSRSRPQWSGETSGAWRCEGCGVEFIERLYEEWLLQYPGELGLSEEDEEGLSLTEFERALEAGEIDREIELLAEELLERELEGLGDDALEEAPGAEEREEEQEGQEEREGAEELEG